jgi:sterol desaturase/sphingolipid hydroxylase (fatty acid hydroxylase superfamily)
MEQQRRLPGWLTTTLALGAFLLLDWLERRRPLRAHTQPKRSRQIRNLVLSSPGAVAMQLAEAPLVLYLTHRSQWGLLKRRRLPLPVEIAIVLLLMDYSYYFWHILLHRIPLLWRFHLVHHVDLNMDASTALRFHLGEILVTLPFRAAQVVLIGLTPLTYSIWQIVFLLNILFHHSDVELPLEWERRLNRILVTPRMHGIHHSIVRRETESNWSSGLSLWDRLHGTLQLNVPQREITIGVPAWQDPESVTLARSFLLPFGPLPPVWTLPDGSEPAPHPTTAPIHRLLP